MLKLIILFIVWFIAPDVFAQTGLPAITVENTADGGQEYSLSLQVLALMTAITVLPGLLLTMTSFTRIIIVLAILRQALGTAQTPSNQILLGLALFITFFVMTPVLTEVYDNSVQPYIAEDIDAPVAINNAVGPIKQFMIAQTRETDIALFADLSGTEVIEKPEDVSMTILLPAFITSELKTAFQIGFILFIPFLIIDLVVASVLMSMGMMMLSPLIISLPFKLMLFVLVDGWSLVLGMLASSFYIS
ncbi:MAG: flagellar type III secretion system pore protein FliP [Gammaproteobacteria bacterium]|nr:flagellar type III secretion system pore protein FliP [Gammaproteobacteria bacterium]MBT8124357.1 flagellar type III secretion system pore protein FliP [Gammaproteobacteria bacterium]NNC68674.1 flagellar type III secretion system pore protein FliP [Gammaproteobacteria bacterium]